MRDFREMNPFAVLLYYAVCVTFPLVTLNPVLIILTLFSAVIYQIILASKRRYYLLYFAVFILSALLNPLFVHRGRTVLFIINDSPITFESLLYGIVTGLSVVSCMILLSSFTEIMTSEGFLYIFGMFSPSVSMILSMAFREFSVLSDKRKEIQTAQKALGNIESNDVFGRIRSGISVYSALISWALENGIVTAESMECRGFGMGRRTFFRRFSFGSGDIFVLISAVICAVFSVYGIICGGISPSYYPDFVFSSVNLPSVLAYAIYAVFSFLPVIISIEEGIKWKFLLRKI